MKRFEKNNNHSVVIKNVGDGVWWKMINLALVTKNQHRNFYNQFMSILKDTNEFNGILIEEENDHFFFDVYNTYTSDDIKGCLNSPNYVKISNVLYIDKRTIPTYLADWEVKKLKNILATYVSIALEDLNFRR